MTHWSRSQLSTPLPYYHSCVFVCVYCMCMHECIKGRSCAQTSVACAEPLQQSAAVIASLVIWTPAFSSRRASGEHSGYRLAHFKRDIISVHFHLLLFFPPGRPRDAEDTEIGKWGGTRAMFPLIFHAPEHSAQILRMLDRDEQRQPCTRND